MELANGMFHFCQRFQELRLSETEFALVLAMHMCYDGKEEFFFFWNFIFNYFVDSTMEDQQFVQMLHSCYFYALYTELNRNRGENEAKIMCNKILQVCFKMTESFIH
jgi:hypothetical protein